MQPELTPPKQPIGIRPELIVDKPTTFQFQQQGKAKSSGKFIAFRSDEADTLLAEKSGGSSKQAERETLLSVDGDYMPRDGRRSFRDASGLPLFDIRHEKSGEAWAIVLPDGDGAGNDADAPIARIKPRSSSLKDILEVDVQNAAADGEQVTLLVLGQDIWKQRTNVYLGEKVIMTTKRTESSLPTYRA